MNQIKTLTDVIKFVNDIWFYFEFISKLKVSEDFTRTDLCLTEEDYDNFTSTGDF